MISRRRRGGMRLRLHLPAREGSLVRSFCNAISHPQAACIPSASKCVPVLPEVGARVLIPIQYSVVLLPFEATGFVAKRPDTIAVSETVEMCAFFLPRRC